MMMAAKISVAGNAGDDDDDALFFVDFAL